MSRLAIVLAFGLSAVAAGQERVPVLPEPFHPGIRDLTPPEFLKAPETSVEAESSAGGFRVSGEFLLLTPRQRGLDFAVFDRANDLTPVGNVQSLNYQPEIGLRASLAYRVPAYDWDVGFTYLYFQSSDAFGTRAFGNGLLYPTLTRAGLTNEATAAFASATLNMNIYDIEFGRHFAFDDSFSARIFGGLRLATVRQGLIANYLGRDADFAAVETRAHYDGVGPLVGGEAAWSLDGGLGVFGRANAALLTGTMRAPFTETNNGGATVYADLRDRYALTVPVVTLGVGVSYQYRGLFLRAGYEVTNWFGVFERAAFVDDFAEGKFLRQSTNLGLDGLFVQLGLEF
jgi:hypothetical protein